MASTVSAVVGGTRSLRRIVGEQNRYRPPQHERLACKAGVGSTVRVVFEPFSFWLLHRRQALASVDHPDVAGGAEAVSAARMGQGEPVGERDIQQGVAVAGRAGYAHGKEGDCVWFLHDFGPLAG